MLSTAKTFFLISAGLYFSSIAVAEQSPNKTSISLLEAISRTFAHNPALHSFGYELRAQRGRELQAGTAASPEIDFMIEDVLGTGEFSAVDSAQATLSIGWLLETDIRNGNRAVARAGSLSLHTEADIRRLEVAAQTARLYLACLANQARLVNAAKTLKLALQTEQAVTRRVAAGKAADAELARTRAEVAIKQLGHEDLEHELRSSIRLLSAQWGETDPDFSRVAGDITAVPVTTSFEALKAQLEHSPEFSRLVSEQRLKQAELALAKAQSRPAWRLNLGVRHFEQTQDQSLLAGLTIPFGERSRNAGGIAAASESLAQAEAAEDALRVRFETTLYVLHEELEHNLHRIETYRSSIIPQLEKALEQTRSAYQLGRYSYAEWRSVQAELLDARSALIEDSISARLKIIEIESLTGVSMTAHNTASSN